MFNVTDTPGISVSSLYAKNIPGATEGYDTWADSSFLPSPYSNALEVYSWVEGNKVSTDARPVETLGWDFHLAVKGFISSADNYLRCKVTDTTDLLDKQVVLYDLASPQVQYTLPMDAQYHNFYLPDLVSQGAGEYAHWRLDIVPEPATLGLLALGAVALLRRKRNASNPSPPGPTAGPRRY